MDLNRLLLAVTGGALLVGAGLAVVAAAPDLTAGRPVAGAATRAPVSPAQSEVLDEAAAHEAGLRLLATALGPDFERISPAAEAPFLDSLAPAPGSEAAEALPAGYAARADVTVSAEGDHSDCAPDGANATCETRQVAGDREVVLGARSLPLEASVPVEIRDVSATQTDGDVVDVSLAVLPDSVTDLTSAVPRRAIKEWLDTYEDALIEAATNPDIAPGSIAARELQEPGGTEGSNEQYLQEALGPEFVVRGEEVVAEPGRIDALPPEMTARAIVRVGKPTTEFECAPVEGRTCRRVTATNGRTVLVEVAEAVHSASGSNFGQTEIRYRCGGGNQEVVVALSVLGKPGGGVTPEIERTVRDWLASMEPALIGAATDGRFHP